MQRVSEPELMDDAEQARAYADADFEQPHALFVELLQEKLLGLPPTGRALDLGCGPGDISFRVARAYEGWHIDAVDASLAMLSLARERAEREVARDRLRFAYARLPDDAPPGNSYGLIFSNSLLHHLPEPEILWSSVKHFSAPGGRVFVMDLMRPKSEVEVEALVERYAAGEPKLLQRDFRASLFAAYRTDEVTRQLEKAGLEGLRVETASDRHWLAWG